MDGFDAFYERLRTRPGTADHLPALDRRLPGGLGAAARAGQRRRLDPPRGRHLRHRARPPARRTALLAERGLGERVEVIDGETACGGMGMLRARRRRRRARGRRQGRRSPQRVREAREALRIWFCLDTLEYLRRGGRIGKAQAWLGGTLKIKPILSLEYEIVPVERVRTAGRAFERMVALRAGAARRRLRRLGRAAHPGARAGRAADRALPRDLRLRARLHLRGRARDRHLHRPRPDRRRRRAARAARLSGLPALSARRRRRRGAACARRAAGRRRPRPTISSLRWRSTCPRQSVRRATSPRRRCHARPRAPWRLLSIESADLARACAAAISSAPPGGGGRGAVVAGATGRRARLRGRGGRGRGAALDRLADLARLLDRHRRHRRRAAFDDSGGDQAGEHAEHARGSRPSRRSPRSR